MNPMPALSFKTPMGLSNGQPSSQMVKNMSKKSECFHSMDTIDFFIHLFKYQAPIVGVLLNLLHQKPKELGWSMSAQKTLKLPKFSWITFGSLYSAALKL